MTGCNPIYYAPNSLNVPLFTEAGETNFTLAGNKRQAEFQGAYALTDNFALLVNGGLFARNNNERGNEGSGKFLEVGGGYLHPIDDNWVFEGYGLTGLGSVENHFNSDSPGPITIRTGDLSASLFRWGVQPNFGYRSRYFSAAISSRLVNLIYYDVEGDLMFDNVDQVIFLTENKSYLLAEPAITLRGEFENIKLQFQMGLSYNITDPKFLQETGFYTIGLHFAF